MTANGWIPLRANQLLLWTFQQTNPCSCAYNVPGVIEIDGPLDTAMLADSWDQVVASHAVLRSIFCVQRGQPMQLAGAVYPRLRVAALTGDGDAVEYSLRTEASKPFNLLEGLPVRAVLWRVATAKHLLQITIHHIVCDGWAMNVIVQDLAAAYDALSRGVSPSGAVQSLDKPPSRPPAETREDTIRYWQAIVTAAETPIDLPIDRLRPPRPTYRGSTLSVQLDGTHLNALRTLATKTGTSFFVVLSTAFGSLLARLACQSAVLLGVVTSNRTPESSGEVEYLADVLPLRVPYDGRTSFRQAVGEAAELLRAAVNDHNAPLSDILAWTRATHDPSVSPLIQVLIVQAPPRHTRLVGDLRWRLRLVDTGSAKFDLTLHIEEQPGEVALRFEYSCDLFNADTIQAIADVLVEFTRSVVEDPDSPVSHLSYVPAEQWRRVVHTWNETEHPLEPQTSVVQLLCEQTRLNADRVAVSWDSGDAESNLTFSQLWDRASALAALVADMGVCAGDRVAVLAERSPELVTAMIALLRLGAVYVPIDPEYPAARIESLIRDADVRLLLHQGTVGALALRHAGARILLDVPPHRGVALPHHDAAPAEPDVPAYLLFTSGSTGAPKGAINLHRGLCNRLLWMQNQFPLGPDDRILVKTPIGFDVSILELLWPLIAGASMHLARPGLHGDPQYLVDTIERKRISVIHFVPPMLRKFLRHPEIGRCRGVLRRVLCSGEALASEDVRGFYQRCDDTTLHNFYGPTEAAIDVTWWDCPPSMGTDIVPIGRPISNTQIYILDPDLRPVPISARGEIFIGGANVGAGYWRHPDATAARFIANPVADAPPGRLFRTGDMGRYLPNGDIVFCGRADRQVKVRGQRLELGEVEAHLIKCDGVRDAVATVAADQLIAFVVVDHEARSTEELRTALRRMLPEYMVPSRISVVPEIPRMPHGKTDYRRLTESVVAEQDVRSLDQPRNPAERTLADVFARVLKVERIGIYDSFFGWGGDSLRAIEVVYRAREMGIGITLQNLLANPTIAELARHVVSADVEKEPERDSSASQDFEPTAAFPMSHLQAALVYHSHTDPRYAIYVSRYSLEGPLRLKLLQASLDAVVRRHAMLRTSFHVSEDGGPVQQVHEEVRVTVASVDLSDRSAGEQDTFILAFEESERRRRFEWDTAPLLRVTLHRRGENRFDVTIAEPFLDGWSVGIVMTEWLARYEAALTGSRFDSPLSTGPSFQDYVRAEQTILSDPEARRFWREWLKGYERSFVTRWPLSAGEERVSIRRHSVRLPRRVAEGLYAFADSVGVPVKTVLLAAHLQTVSMLVGRRRIITGMISNGRPEERGGEGLVGLFLNALPLTVEVGPGSWRDLVRAAYEAEVAVTPYRRFPLAAIQVERGGPLFDTVFNYVHFREYERPGGTIRILERRANDQTYFDITAQLARDWRSDELILTIDVNGSAIGERQAASIAGLFQRVLEAASFGPDADRSHIAALSHEEDSWCRQQLTGPSVRGPSSSAITLFELQARERPTALAVRDSERSLTYEELARAMRRIASALRRRGIGRGDVVPLLARRGADYLEAFLGIIASGAACWPLGPNWPVHRISLALRESGAGLLLHDIATAVNAELVRAAVDWPIQFANVESFVAEADFADGAEQIVWPAAEDPAYVLYTSGSTGLPKAATVLHKGMVNHLLAKVSDLTLSAGSTVAQTASQTFDISIWQMLAPLVSGGAVAVADEETVRDPAHLCQFVAEAQVSVLEVVPSMLRAMMTAIQNGSVELETLSGLAFLVVTGEAFSSDLCREWFASYPDVCVVNAYGPTECSDDVTHGIVCRAADLDSPTVSIGRPVRNTRLYIVDDQMRPTPLGTPGELLIAGNGVGGGYLNDSRATRAVFLPNPFAEDHECSTVYRSGDLVRILPTGSIEFLGRLDRQVKVSGFRVEPAEIEATARQHAAIADAVVAPRSVAGTTLLTAYLVPKSGVRVDVRAIREFLASRLPAHAVPSSYVVVDALPVGENGKTDYSALPKVAPEWSRPPLRTVSPRDELERAVAEVWQEVLELPSVGIHETFADLGGHSLLGMRLCARLSFALNQPVGVSDLLNNPTIARLCAALRRRNTVSSEADCRPAAARDDRRRHPRLARLRITSIPLADLVRCGDEPPVDAAALGYVSEAALKRAGLSRERVLAGLLGGDPVLRSIYDAPFGRIGHVLLPLTGSDLFADCHLAVRQTSRGMEFVDQLGARCVSLTGLLAAATDYGLALLPRDPGATPRPAVTTGHAVAVAAVVLNVDCVLRACARNMRNEWLGVLGAGSIGSATLSLLLSRLPHPRAITLCDLYSRRDRLDALARVARALGFRGDLRVLQSDGPVPVEFYRVSCIVGAASAVPNVLDIRRLRPGTIVVDDSAPHCFDDVAAVGRMNEQRDVVVTEAGLLRAPQAIPELRFLPDEPTASGFFSCLTSYRTHDTHLMGCVMASILTGDDNIPATGGPIEAGVCDHAYLRLTCLGFGAPNQLTCGDVVTGNGVIEAFRQLSPAFSGGLT